MKLSVIVPVYNEEATVKKILQKLLKIKEIGEIVVVDDGSTDGTKKILNSQKSKKIKVHRQRNQGKGSAVRLGLSKVSGEYILIQDADLEYDPQDIKHLLRHLDRHGVKVVYGSRFLGPHSNLLFWHRVGNHFLNALVNVLYNTTLSDMETCYKLIPTDLMKDLSLKANGFDLEPEITCKILKRDIKIFEVPISYVGRGFDEGKKITWRDGVTAFWTVVKLRYN